MQQWTNVLNKEDHMQQPDTPEQLQAEALEGQKIVSIFQKDINARSTNSQIGQGATAALIKAYPALEGNRQFFNLSRSYASRADMKKKYSSKQITAYAAAEVLMPMLDIEPKNFYALFAVCCIYAGTHQPTKEAHYEI